jgi:adenosine deaminase CECR1
MENYLKQRQQLVNENNKLRFDYNIKLSEKEIIVNKILKELIKKEQKTKKLTQNFFERKSEVESSTLYKILKKMPKGAILHGHYLALVDVSKVIEFASNHPNVTVFLNSQ